MNKKLSISLDEWMDEAFKQLPPPPPNSFTVADVVKKTGICNRTIISRLEKLVHLGKLKKGKCQQNGVQSNYFIPVEFLKNEIKRHDGREITGNKNVPGKAVGKSNKRIPAKNSKNGKRS